MTLEGGIGGRGDSAQNGCWQESGGGDHQLFSCHTPPVTPSPPPSLRDFGSTISGFYQFDRRAIGRIMPPFGCSLLWGLCPPGGASFMSPCKCALRQSELSDFYTHSFARCSSLRLTFLPTMCLRATRSVPTMLSRLRCGIVSSENGDIVLHFSVQDT